MTKGHKGAREALYYNDQRVIIVYKQFINSHVHWVEQEYKGCSKLEEARWKGKSIEVQVVVTHPTDCLI